MLYSNQQSLILSILFLVSLIDIVLYRIPNASVLLIAILSFWEGANLWTGTAALCLGATLLSIKQNTKLIGYGDLKLISACSLSIPAHSLGLFLLAIAAATTITRSIIKHKHNIPMAPAIFFATMLCFTDANLDITANFLADL